MEPAEMKPLEEALKQVSWWREPAPGLWRRALAFSQPASSETRRGLAGAVRAHWLWAVGAMAAAIVLAAVLDQPWWSTDSQPAPAYRDIAAQSSPDNSAASGSGDARWFLAAIPRFSGPAPAGWASGVDDRNFVLAASPAERLLAGEVLTDHHPVTELARRAAPGGLELVAAFDYVQATRPVEEKVTTTRRTLQVPAGKYATIILGAHGTAPMAPALIELQRGDDKFPISAGPGTNYFISFTEGWEVREGEARVVISSTSSACASMTSAAGFAWGITARGPVAFPEQRSP